MGGVRNRAATNYMAVKPQGEDFQTIIFEFGQYLSDQIPPLLAADCVESLLKCPPDIVATGIRNWVGSQHRGSSSLSVSDYLYHAVKKIHMIAEYKLLPAPEIKAFIDKIKPYVISFCPADEQPVLVRSLSSIDSMVETVQAKLDVVYGTSPNVQGKQQEAAPRSASIESELGKISVFLERLKKEMGTRNIAANPSARQELISDVLVQTARAANRSDDLEKAFEYIRSIGLQASADDVIRALGRNLPEWNLTPKENAALPEDKNLSALKRVVLEAPDAKESGIRFHQMIQTAIERLNAGHLQQAANMIDLAEKMIAEKQVEPNLVENIRNRGHQDIQLENLRKYTETPEVHPQFLKVLNFFRALEPAGLLDALRLEEKRERRKLLLAIIEVHRETARNVVLERLRVPFSQNFSPEEGYFRRNLVYLLRRIPASKSENEAEVIDLVARHTELDFPLIVVKEAIGYLGHFKHREAEEVLKALLQEVESLLSGGKSNFEKEELLGLLDRICAAFARTGTSSARKILLDHAFSKKPKLGDTMNRLSDLAGYDLAGDPITVGRLLSALHACLPMKVLGFVVRTKEDDLKYIVHALSGTSDTAVRQVFEELKQRFPDSPAAHLAARSSPVSPQGHEEKRSAPEAAASMEGDMQLFGLPGLFQNLGDHALSGTLSLKRPDGQVFGTVELSNGNLVTAQVGLLTDEVAIYQLLESPQPGTFQFVRNASPKDVASVKQLFPMVLEGVRRYDEFSEARAILPDHVRVAGSGLQPSVHPEEKDGILFRELWNLVRKGATPAECDAQLKFDSYRIRRLLVHWFQSGSITIVY